jgi:hypothetical protein
MVKNGLDITVFTGNTNPYAFRGVFIWILWIEACVFMAMDRARFDLESTTAASSDIPTSYAVRRRLTTDIQPSWQAFLSVYISSIALRAMPLPVGKHY